MDSKEIKQIRCDLEMEIYTSKDLESSLFVLIESLNIQSHTKCYIGAVEIIRRSLETHNKKIQEILKDIRNLGNNEEFKGDI